MQIVLAQVLSLVSFLTHSHGYHMCPPLKAIQLCKKNSFDVIYDESADHSCDVHLTIINRNIHIKHFIK